MEFLSTWSASLAGAIWGLPMVFLLFGAGLFFTVYLLFPQFRYFKHSVEIVSGKFDSKSDKGEITHFQALCAALSATIGLGNIAGVAVAISSGGPGAVFWMWVAGFLGMSTKLVSIALSHLNRSYSKETGSYHGGPMYTIKNGLDKKWHFLAPLFSFFTIFAAIGAGNMFQSNQMANILENSFKIPHATTGIIFCIFTGLVLVGGIKRIGNIASKLVPTMVVLYFIGAIGILGKHYELIPGLFYQIFHDAFNGTAAVGGFTGIAFKEVVIQGVRRAVFSNEAGLGSAAMAHSAAKSHSLQEGIVGMIGPFIDTIVVCTLTALVILITGVWNSNLGLEGSELTTYAFSLMYGNFGTIMMSLIIVLFAFSSIISWSYYGEQGAVYLFGEKSVKPYRVIFTLMVFVGAIMKLETIINFSDAFLGLMAIPNLLANILMIRVLRDKLKRYNHRMGENF